jgi:drug/metabolite transporter (DMT)-like permease
VTSDHSSAAVRRGIVRCGLAAVLFGATTPVASQIADSTNAPTLAGLLYLGAAVAVLPLALRSRPAPGSLRRGGPRLAAAVVAGGFLGPILLVAGLQRTPAATASLLLNAELVATAVLAAAFFGEHLGRRVLSGTALVVLAGGVLAWSGTPELRVGALLVVAACACWGLDNCVTADLDALAPEHVTLAKGVIAGGTSLVLGLATGGDLPAGGDLAIALLAGALGYGASITLWVQGARDLGAARGQLVFSSAPFVGVLVAWFVLGDSIRGAELAALVIAGVGVSRVLGSDHAHEHSHEPLLHEHEHVHDEHHRHHDEPVTARHSHLHRHERLVHAHPHVPDLHHRHPH